MGSSTVEPAPYSTTITDGDQAKRYSQFRPSYPKEVYDVILQHLKEDERKLAVDVATGSGQAAVQLADFFTQVVATDGNEEQLKHAKAAQNVIYRYSDAHSIDLPDSCADLVTAASALHWFELSRFYKECRRVLKPHGCLAAWAIPLGLAKLEVPAAPGAAAACDAALYHIYEGVLGQYWDERKRWADKMYRGIEPSEDDFEKIELLELDYPAELTVEQLVGYISSWSAYSIYRKKNPDQPDPLPEFKQKLLQSLQTEGAPADTVIIAHIPLCLLIAQGPKPLYYGSDSLVQELRRVPNMNVTDDLSAQLSDA